MLSRVTTTSQIGETQLIPARVLISRSVIFTAESMRRRLELIVATKTTLVAGWFTLPGGNGGGEGGGGEGGGEGGGGSGESGHEVPHPVPQVETALVKVVPAVRKAQLMRFLLSTDRAVPWRGKRGGLERRDGAPGGGRAGGVVTQAAARVGTVESEGMRGAHLKHVVHVRFAGNVEAQRLVER